MDTNGTSHSVKVASGTQSSIRSFFQPRAPNYTAPPSAPTSQPEPSSGAESASIPAPVPPELHSLPAHTFSVVLPKQASISPISENQVQPLRRINSLLLQIAYPDSFYRTIIDPSTRTSLSRVALWADSPSAEPKVIGGIVCRLEPSEANPRDCELYIQSLALLSPFRSKGLATALLESIVAAATGLTTVNVTSLYAHVWTENEDGLKWYAARGFTRDKYALQGYYRKLKPDTAWVLRRRLVPSDHLQHAKINGISSGVPTQDQPSDSGVASSNAPSPNLRPTIPQVASYQDRRPDREWNDLPDEMAPPNLLNPQSGAVSEASSRSSSKSRQGKKKRQYPAAAFGDSGR
ncbi:hypothetical protein F5884DRAFT_274347 [Xylogone sp. PMI_703]|nr:hypothetical protein F5884DRAFT_274347 [Xylogone sp. PMI_703]